MANNTNEPTEFSGVWGAIYVERVTINGSTGTNMVSCGAAIANARTDKTGVVVAIRRYNPDSPSPVQDEFGMVVANLGTNSPIGRRYRNGWAAASYGSNYTATISDGSVFDVLSMRYTPL